MLSSELLILRSLNRLITQIGMSPEGVVLFKYNYS